MTPDEYMAELFARRVRNLRILMEQDNLISERRQDFAAMTDFQPAQLSQWTADPSSSAHRKIREETARKLEFHCGRPYGWMDEDQA